MTDEYAGEAWADQNAKDAYDTGWQEGRRALRYEMAHGSVNERNVAHACPICGNVHLPTVAAAETLT